MRFTLLVPTDFSNTAEKAFTYALDIASRSGGTVYLCHVYTPAEAPFIETVEETKVYNLHAERECMDSLHALRAKWANQYKHVDVVAVLARSPLVGSLLNVAKEFKISMIVMGTQGASGLKKVVVGTIATRLLEQTTIPLLLVPEKFEWTAPEKIVLASNFLQQDLAALAVVGALARLYASTIRIVHLTEEPDTLEQDQLTLDRHMARLQQSSPDLNLNSSALQVESVIDALEGLHERIPYDMLVMVRHEKKFLEHFYLESCTKHMAYLTWIPLLIIPSRAEHLPAGD